MTKKQMPASLGANPPLTPHQKFELRLRMQQRLQQAKEKQKLEKNERAKRRFEQAIEKQVVKTDTINIYNKQTKKRRKPKKSDRWFDSSGKADFVPEGLKKEPTVSGGHPGSGRRS